MKRNLFLGMSAWMLLGLHGSASAQVTAPKKLEPTTFKAAALVDAKADPLEIPTPARQTVVEGKLVRTPNVPPSAPGRSLPTTPVVAEADTVKQVSLSAPASPPPPPAGRTANTSTAPTRNVMTPVADKIVETADPVPTHTSLRGKLLDFTHNHGIDRRMFSRSLFQKRDLYVYLPPNFSKDEQYPLAIFLHGFGQDEKEFLSYLPVFDRAIANGEMPPMILAAPDGSYNSEGGREVPSTYFLNSQIGFFEDYLLNDVWPTLTKRFPVRTDRKGHILLGVGGGGYGAFSIGMRHRETFGVIAGLMPAVNLRYVDGQGDPNAKFDPRRWVGQRSQFDDPDVAYAVAGRRALTVGQIIHPVFGNNDETTEAVSNTNPTDLLDRAKLLNGELDMMIAYGRMDAMNLDVQCESFAYLAKLRGINVTVTTDEQGGHDQATGLRLAPAMTRWLGRRLGATPSASNTSSEILQTGGRATAR